MGLALQRLLGLPLSLPVQGRDGDFGLASGTARGELEAAGAAGAARQPRVPAGPLPFARGRCDQRAKRGAEAGRELHPLPGAKACWPGRTAPLGGRPDARLPGAHAAAAVAARGAGAGLSLPSVETAKPSCRVR